MSQIHDHSPKRRSRRTHQAILEATVKLLEEQGYKALTIEGIAAEAKAGKQTIYRWWGSKAELVMEAYIAASDVRITEPNTGALRDDLTAILKPMFKLNSDYHKGTALANKSLMAEAQLDSEFLALYRRLHEHWRIPLRNVLTRGKLRGELSPDADSEAIIDLMLGASWYRLLLEHAPLDEQFAEAIVAMVVEAGPLKSSEK